MEPIDSKSAKIGITQLLSQYNFHFTIIPEKWVPFYNTMIVDTSSRYYLDWSLSMHVPSITLLAAVMIQVLLCERIHSQDKIHHYIYPEVYHEPPIPEKESLITDHRKDILRPYFWLLRSKYFDTSYPKWCLQIIENYLNHNFSVLRLAY